MGAPTLLALLALAAAATAQSTDTEPCWYDAEGDFVKTCASDAEIDVGLCECRVRLTDVSCTSAELTKSTCPDAGHSEPEDTSNLPCCSACMNGCGGSHSAECKDDGHSDGDLGICDCDGVCEEGGVAPSGDTIAKVPDYAGDQIQRCIRVSDATDDRGCEEPVHQEHVPEPQCGDFPDADCPDGKRRESHRMGDTAEECCVHSCQSGWADKDQTCPVGLTPRSEHDGHACEGRSADGTATGECNEQDCCLRTCTAEHFPAGDSGGACPDGTMRRSTDDGHNCDGEEDATGKKTCDADDCCVFTCANFDGECPEGKVPRAADDMHECEEREGDSHDGARVCGECDCCVAPKEEFDGVGCAMWDRREELDCDDGVCSEDTKNGEVLSGLCDSWYAGRPADGATWAPPVEDENGDVVVTCFDDTVMWPKRRDDEFPEGKCTCMDFRDAYCPQLATYNPAMGGIDLSVGDHGGAVSGVACDCPPAPAAEMACMGPPECEGKPEGECGDTCKWEEMHRHDDDKVECGPEPAAPVWTDPGAPAGGASCHGIPWDFAKCPGTCTSMGTYDSWEDANEKSAECAPGGGASCDGVRTDITCDFKAFLETIRMALEDGNDQPMRENYCACKRVMDDYNNIEAEVVASCDGGD